MASTQQLKSRIRSVKSTKQITKAMQMVAASKMRRAQDFTKASQPYSRAANQLLAQLGTQTLISKHKWFAKREIKRRLFIVIASDKGLAGAYNANIFKTYLDSLKKDRENGIENTTIAVGRKISQFVTRLQGVEIAGVYSDLPDKPDNASFHAILTAARNMFESGEVDAVDVIFTRFVTSMTQKSDTLRLFPAGFKDIEVDSSSGDDIKFEPSPKEVINDIAYRLISARLYQTLLDARASEHSMRMLAMKNATDNASSLVDDLTLAMNKARQGAITQELSEISAGVEAMNNE